MANRVSRIGLNFVSISAASAAGGLVAKVSLDRGLSWDPIDFDSQFPMTVPISTVGKDNLLSFWTAEYPDLQFSYVNGPAVPATWKGYVAITRGESNPGV